MNGSTILSWALIGPLLGAALATSLWQATGVRAFALVAQLAGATALAVGVAAFVANWRRARRVGSSRDSGER